MPLDIRIAREDASARLDGVGLTPHIRWSPPLIGTPGGYQVVLYEIEGLSGYTIISSRGFIATDEPEIRLPSGILETGKAYVIAVDAIDAGIEPVPQWMLHIHISGRPGGDATLRSPAGTISLRDLQFWGRRGPWPTTRAWSSARSIAGT